jgi:hypothetical protein
MESRFDRPDEGDPDRIGRLGLKDDLKRLASDEITTKRQKIGFSLKYLILTATCRPYRKSL